LMRMSERPKSARAMDLTQGSPQREPIPALFDAALIFRPPGHRSD
jgi:hypothetical protein